MAAISLAGTGGPRPGGAGGPPGAPGGGDPACGPAAARPQAGEHPPLAIEESGRARAQVGPSLAQLAVGDAVEGPGRHLLAHSEGPQAGPQLAGRLAGERQGAAAAGLTGVLLKRPAYAP